MVDPTIKTFYGQKKCMFFGGEKIHTVPITGIKNAMHPSAKKNKLLLYNINKCHKSATVDNTHSKKL